MNSSSFFLTKGQFIENKQSRLTEDYIIGKQLGKGAYGTVYCAQNRSNGKTRAIKAIKKTSIRNPIQFQNQLQILKKVDHPHIIKTYETYQDQNNLYLVTDLCQGGELFDRLIQKGSFSEAEAREIFKQMLYAVKYCHGQKIAHRDLKPQNFLFLGPDYTSLKLIDFGLSFQWKQDMRAELLAKGETKLVGTSYYIAPEIIKGSYDERCDIWSLGVILYILVTAIPPFDGQNDKKILQSVQKGFYTFNIPEMKHISSQLKDLISHMLQPEGTRYSLDDILRHPWMNGPVSVADLRLDSSKLQKFTQYCQLRKFAISSIAFQMSAKEVELYGQLFRRIDTDMDGFISARELKAALEGQKQLCSLQELQYLIRFVDTDMNGKINYCEFISCLLEKSTLLRPENIESVFRSLDLDRDGKISPAELKCGLSCGLYSIDDGSIRSIIKNGDLDGDGHIDYKEFNNVLQQI